MSLANVQKKTLGIRELSRELGVTVVRPDQYKDDYIVTKDEERRVTTRKKLRAVICEVGGEPLDEE